MTSQSSLFGSFEDPPAAKPGDDRVRSLKVLITVKAAPNPSERYGETVCIAGLSVDLENPGWIRLYPVNFRELDSSGRFKKYDIVSVDAKPARQDQRAESWRPLMGTLEVLHHLPPWKKRSEWLAPYIETSMREINKKAKGNPKAKSLALVQPTDVDTLELFNHPGWTDDEKRKIQSYVNQLEIPLADQPRTFQRTPLEPPRMKGAYRYRCSDKSCSGHRQGLLDWEFVALQRNLSDASDDEMRRQLQLKFLEGMCSPRHRTAFYVGNQAKRTNVFSVLGVYYPKVQ